MWQQSIDPLHNLAASAGAASIPIIVLFVLLLSRRFAGHIAALLTLLSGLIVAILIFHMPANLALLSAVYGILNGMFPIGWIVISAVFLYNLSVANGTFAKVCKSIESITADRRLQALLIAFCFGAFLEGCAGFGAPVAITTGMLVGLGFDPIYAAGICLLANSAPVAFGSIGIPIVTAGQTSGIDPAVIGRMVAHQLPVLSFIVPFWLIILMSGWRRTMEIWPPILVTAATYTTTMFVVAQYLGPLLPNILAAVVSIICLVSFLKVWKPKSIWRFPGEADHLQNSDNLTAANSVSFVRQAAPWTAFLLLILLVSNWGYPGIKAMLDSVTVKLPIAGLDGRILSGVKPISVVYTLNWLSAAGTSILFAALLTIVVQRIPAATAIKTFGETLQRLCNPLITIGSIVGFAYLANFCGMSLALGRALTVMGQLFPLVAPVVGWIGVFVSGSDTASNALFSNMQKATALHLHMNPALTIAANTDGGVCAKMISPQSIAVATASSKTVGQEGEMFRRTLPHSIAMLVIICVLTLLQAHVLSWMVPKLAAAASASKTVAPLGADGITILMISAFIIILLAWINFREPATSPSVQPAK
jgi:lactate permease